MGTAPPQTHTLPLEETALKRPCRHLSVLAQWLMWRHKLSSMPRWVFLSILPPSLSSILSHISICNMICLFFLIPTPSHYYSSQFFLLLSIWVIAKCFKQLRSAGTFKETASDCLRMRCSKWQVMQFSHSPWSLSCPLLLILLEICVLFGCPGV